MVPRRHLTLLQQGPSALSPIHPPCHTCPTRTCTGPAGPLAPPACAPDSGRRCPAGAEPPLRAPAAARRHHLAGQRAPRNRLRPRGCASGCRVLEEAATLMVVRGHRALLGVPASLHPPTGVCVACPCLISQPLPSREVRSERTTPAPSSTPPPTHPPSSIPWALQRGGRWCWVARQGNR